MFNPIFDPKITILHQNAMRIFIESITDHITPNTVTFYAYRVGAECLHVLKLDDRLEITITDGKTDIPNKENCLDYLRTGHIQIGVFDSMDVTYTINNLLNTFKKKNERLICSFLQYDEQ
ncbi:hypothetical protein A6E00_13525 [Vibrio diabolicus]|uniref:Uncharacterized protein n=1 Tax=Vibrio sp. FF_273 TaxID=1652830 RepID=A0A0H4A4S0_9VIBR|nr:hypothetical protein [Vibrio diabolicus]AKN40881.1 hypothetical protein [Vibrio sp. FF_273]OCH65483.1 hypothetical protein A6E00_13525 [Vibrio diabolicus]